VARARSLQSCRQILLAAGFQKCAGIVLPRCFVEIRGQEETGFVQQHRINAHDETTALIVPTREMPAEHLISYGKKTRVGAFGTFDSRFFADSRDPLIGARRRIAGPASLSAFETARIDIFASVKQRGRAATKTVFSVISVSLKVSHGVHGGSQRPP
jgi:hypothetical protein